MPQAQIGGAQLYYETHGEGAPLILIPGFGVGRWIWLKQVPALAEHFRVITFNRLDNYKFGTVGPPMPSCRVRIASDGEILVRSEMMFSSYYKEPDKAAEVMRDGWLLTGDLGAMDADGFLP